MDRREYIKAIKDVIYLAYCGVNGKIPGDARVRKMDITAVYEAANKHLLTAICAMSLESAGVKDERFTQAKGKAMRKYAQMDIDRAQLFERLEAAQIWYMPLKGSLLKDLYPKYGMRQMSDNDILFDSARARDVKQIMESMGFACERFGHGNHDVYFKKPVSNFEMHTSIINHNDNRIFEYYRNVKDRLIKDEDNNFGYHFSDEDFYIFMTAHEYKHYSNGGTGLRSVLDTNVYLTKPGDKLDMEYIEGECEKLGIAEFERQSRSLAMHLFGGKKLTDEDKEMLRYIVFSGTYGTLENSVNNRVAKHGSGKLAKIKYTLGRLTVPISEKDTRYEAMKSFYPWFYEKKYRLPLLFFYRLLRGITSKRKKSISEIKVLMKHKS